MERFIVKFVKDNLQKIENNEDWNTVKNAYLLCRDCLSGYSQQKSRKIFDKFEDYKSDFFRVVDYLAGNSAIQRPSHLDRLNHYTFYGVMVFLSRFKSFYELKHYLDAFDCCVVCSEFMYAGAMDNEKRVCFECEENKEMYGRCFVCNNHYHIDDLSQDCDIEDNFICCDCDGLEYSYCSVCGAIEKTGKCGCFK